MMKFLNYYKFNIINSMNNIKTKKKWLKEINILDWEGDFKNAKKIINSGIKKKGWKINKTEAKEILKSCGIDVPY